jgi:DNA-binding Xre family transcriptional regulator
MSFKWKLKEQMAHRGIWKCTDLARLLNAYGINISVSMVTRIVEKAPERINTQVLDAICDILKCNPSDILVHIPSNTTIEVLTKAAGENIGIKPGPKPKKHSADIDITHDILGPKGDFIK